MKIVHLVPALFDRQDGILGGAERYAFELARHVADHSQTTLVSFGAKDREFSQGSLRVRVLGRPTYVRGQRSNPFSLAVLAELQKADVVHCHQQHIVASSVAALSSRLTGRRVFVSDLGGGGWDISSYVSTDRWYHGHLHISKYSRSVAGHDGKRWAHVIYGGVDTHKFSPPVGGSRRKVLFVGRLMPHKGVDDLIKAMPPELELEIIGQPYNESYTEELRRLAAGKNVHFRSDVTDSGLVEAYREALCVVLPSVYRTMYGVESKVPELLGQTLLEGMACGAPAICTEVASMPEVVEDGVTGFVVPPNSSHSLAERIRQLDANPTLVADLGRAGRTRVLEQFDWPVVARRCMEIYVQ